MKIGATTFGFRRLLLGPARRASLGIEPLPKSCATGLPPGDPCYRSWK